jgi:hypothetical protein
MPKKMPSREERFKQIAKMEKEQKYYADRRVQIVKDRLKCHKFIGEHFGLSGKKRQQDTIDLGGHISDHRLEDACEDWGSYYNPELTQPKGKELNS